MKKLMTLVLAVICAVSLFGCAAAGYENENQTPNAQQENLLTNNENAPTETTENQDTTTEEVTNIQELPLTIVSNEKTITPYFHLVNSKEWDGEFFVIGDGVDLSSVLEELETEGRIPRVEYSHDFGVVLGDGVTVTHILLYNDAFEQLNTVWDISDLSKLNAGHYYVGIVVRQDGDYIAEANEKESVGFACVVRLTIKPTA